MNFLHSLNRLSRIVIWLLGFAFVCISSIGSAQEVIGVRTPYGGAPSPGDYSFEPFSVPRMESSRYQQVYSASEFGQLGGSPGSITKFLFQADMEFGRGTSAYLDLEILFGVTPRYPDALSTTFAENVGNGLTMVHSRGVFLLGHAGGGALAAFELETPFLYDPTQGNLLMEIRTYSIVNADPFSTGPGVYEAWNVQGDSVSRVYAHDVNATTGIADSMGLTTYFVVTPVPEPSTFAIMGLALGAWWWRYCRQRTNGTHS